MYQWIDPASGVTQLSGSPPAWYRSSETGPQVLVFENGRLIDDTRIAVSAVDRTALRAEAFGRTAASAPQPEPVENPAQESGSEPVQAASAPAPEPAALPAQTGQEPAEDAKATIERLRAIVSVWDARRAEEAKDLIDRASRD